MKQKQNKKTALCAMKTPTHNVNKPWSLLQTTGGKEKLNIIVMQKYYVMFRYIFSLTNVSFFTSTLRTWNSIYLGKKWMVISDIPLVNEHLTLFTKTLRNNDSNLNNDLYNLIKRMSQTAYVDFRLKTMITFLWNVLYMIILEEIYFLLYEFMAEYI
jgi:hypothetical protein